MKFFLCRGRSMAEAPNAVPRPGEVAFVGYLATSDTPGPRTYGYGRNATGSPAMLIAVGKATIPYKPPLGSVRQSLETVPLFQPTTLAGTGLSAVDEAGPEPPGTRCPEVLVLGPVRVTGWLKTPDAARERVVTELTSYLALHRDHPVAGEMIRAALWADELLPEGSARTLRDYLSHVRGSLGTDVLPPSRRGRGYQVTTKLGCDWDLFSRLANESAAAEELEKALELVRGRPFEDVDYAWAHREHLVARMEVAIISAAQRLGRTRLAAGRPDLAAETATRGLLGTPYDLSLWSLFLAASKMQGPDVFERARRDAAAVLGDDLRLVPAYSEN